MRRRTWRTSTRRFRRSCSSRRRCAAARMLSPSWTPRRRVRAASAAWSMTVAADHRRPLLAGYILNGGGTRARWLLRSSGAAIARCELRARWSEGSAQGEGGRRPCISVATCWWQVATENVRVRLCESYIHASQNTCDNAGISRLILHTFDKCVCRGRQSCSRGQLSALAVATCATCAGSRGRAATVTRPTCARCAGSRERAAWSCPLHLLHRRRAPRATALEGARRPLRVRRAPRATALEGGRGGRRGPRVDARVHHQPSEASGQQKRHAHAVSRAWLTRGE